MLRQYAVVKTLHLVRSLGADKLIDYKTAGFYKR